MWISEKMKFGGGSAPVRAETGTVSIGGASVAVLTESEKRSLTLASPAGFSSGLRLGDRVLLLTTDEGEAIVAGVIAQRDGGVPEQVNIAGSSCTITGGSCTINADGSISITGGQIGLNGTVRIEGSLYVNGEKYEPNGGVL